MQNMGTYYDFNAAFIKAIQEGKIDEFINHLNNLLLKNHRNYLLWLFLARTYEIVGEIDKAINSYNQAFEIDKKRTYLPEEIRRFCQKNKIEYWLNNNGWKNSLESNRTSDEDQRPDSIQYNAYKNGNSLLSKGNLEEAFEIFNNLYIQNYFNRAFLLQFATLCQRLKKHELAFKVIDNALSNITERGGKEKFLLAKAQFQSSLENYRDAENTYLKLVKITNNTRAKFSHYTQISRIQLKLGKFVEAKKNANNALRINPNDNSIQNLITIIENYETARAAGEEFKIEFNEEQVVSISPMIKIDIEDYEYRDEEIIKNGWKPNSDDAKRLLEEAGNNKNNESEEFAEHYPLYLEAAKAFSDLPPGSYDTNDYYFVLERYAALRGASIYNNFLKIIFNEDDKNFKELERLKDSACSYLLEALYLQNLLNKNILIPLNSYVRIQVFFELFSRGYTFEESILSGSFADIFRFCLTHKDMEIEKIAYNSVIACGAVSISVWNKLAKVPGGTGIIYDKMFKRHERESIYRLICSLEHLNYNPSIKPGEFFKQVFLNRKKKVDTYKSEQRMILNIPFEPYRMNDLKAAWNKVKNYNYLLTNTDIDITEKIDRVIILFDRYLYREKEERTNILYKVRVSLEEEIKFIKVNTTYWGRVFFYPLLMKWREGIDRLEKDRLKQTLPDIRAIIDPPVLQRDNENYHINLLLKNEGESTSEGVFLKYEICNLNRKKIHTSESKLKIDKEIGVQKSITVKLSIPSQITRENDAIFLLLCVTPIYENKKTETKNFDFTLEKQSESHLAYDEIPWNETKIPPKYLFKGREDILNRLVKHFDSINRNKTYILYGLTRTGKSSILIYLSEHLDGKQTNIDSKAFRIITFHWKLDLASSQENASDMWAHLLHNCILNRLEELAKNKIISYESIPELKNESKARFRDWYRIISYLNKKLIYPIFLIDEFSHYKNLVDKRRIDSSFLAAIRSFAIDGLAGFVFSGTYDLKELIRDPDYGITGQLVNTIELQVSQINTKAAIELINVIQDKLKFTDDAIKHILKLSANIPYFIQILCKNCANYAVESKKRIIGYPEVELVTKILTGEDKSQEESMIEVLPPGTFMNNQFDPKDPSSISALISSICYFNKNEIDARGVNYSEIQELWGKKAIPGFAPKLAEAINYLKTKGILNEVVDEGMSIYKISVDLFRRWWGIQHSNIELELDPLRGD